MKSDGWWVDNLFVDRRIYAGYGPRSMKSGKWWMDDLFVDRRIYVGYGL